MPSQQDIYNRHAEQYALLVSREDYEQNIPQALRPITTLDAIDIVELGAGTGRLTGLLAPKVKSICALDVSHHMLSRAANQLRKTGLQNWTLAVADHRDLPIANHRADLVISGWSLSYLAVWSGDNWRYEVEQALEEGRRVLRPGGAMILLETLGTGHATPYRPQKLAAYYTLLEEQGFRSTWIRTDFRFESIEEASELLGFFFGEEAAKEMTVEGSVTVPECTGIWWLKIS